MKTPLILAALTLLALAVGAAVAMAQQQSGLKFQWQQENVNDSFWGWEMHVSESPDGPWEPLAGIPLGDRPADPAELVSLERTVDTAGLSGTRWFAVRARNLDGEVSPFSNAVEYDFTPPMTPVEFRLVPLEAP